MLMTLFVYVYIGSRYLELYIIGISFEKNSRYCLNEIFKRKINSKKGKIGHEIELHWYSLQGGMYDCLGLNFCS